MKSNSIKIYSLFIIGSVVIITILCYLYLSIYPKFLVSKLGSLAIMEGYATETEVTSCKDNCLEFFTKRILRGVEEQTTYASLESNYGGSSNEPEALIEKRRYFSFQKKLTKLLEDYDFVYENYEKTNKFSRHEATKQLKISYNEDDFTKSDYRITNFVSVDNYLIADLILTEGSGEPSLLIIKVELDKYRLVAGPGTFFADDPLTKDIPLKVIQIVNDRLNPTMMSNPLMKYLPYINQGLGFEINYSSKQGVIKYRVILYGNSDDDFIKSKNNALDWIKGKKIDVEKINIEFVEKQIIRPKENYLE